MKQYRTIIILLGVLLTLGAIATWDEWMTDKEAQEGEKRNEIASFEVDKVTKLTINGLASPAGEPAPGQVEILKEGEDWRVISPVNAKADPEVMKSFLTTIADYKFERVASEDRSTWGQYGLESPSRIITLEYSNDEDSTKTFELSIGEKAAVGYSVYFRTGDSDRVLLGSQYLLVSTSKSLHDFRDKRLTYATQNDVASFSYQRKGVDGFRLERKDGKFKIVSPREFDSDHNAAMDFLGDVFGIKVTDFYDEPDESLKKLFDDPGIVLSWTTESGETSTLKALYNDGKYYAAFDPEKQIVQIPTSLNSKLSKELIDFRNRRILEFDSGDIVQVTIDGEVFKRHGGDWFTAANYDLVASGKEPPPVPESEDEGENGVAQIEDDSKPKSEPNIRSLLVDLEFAKTREFFGPDSVAAKRLPATPEHRIVLKFKAEGDGAESKSDLVIEIFGPDGNEHQFVRHSSSSVLYSVPNGALDSLKKSEPDQELDKAEANDGAEVNKG